MTAIAPPYPVRSPTLAPARGAITYLFPSLALCLLLCAWMVTWGDWTLFQTGTFCGFYDAQARAMLQGQLEVPPSAIGFEAFIRDGKSYGYYGIGPSLPRIGLVVLWPGMDGRWSRAMMLAACCINLWCAVRILRWVGQRQPPCRMAKWLHNLFILCAGIGSTNLFLLCRSYTYHEAIMWGATFALLFAVGLVTYLHTPRLPTLIWTGLAAFMSFQSRPTAGAGALLGMIVLFSGLGVRCMRRRGFWQRWDRWRPPFLPAPGTREEPCPNSTTSAGHAIAHTDRPLLHALVALALILLTLGVYFGVTYAKFHTLDGVPVKYYRLYMDDPRRLAITQGRQIHPENLPTGLANYFGFRAFHLDPVFPWVYLSRQPVYLGSPAIDSVEQFSSIPISMPALTLLALIGAGPLLFARTAALARFRLPALTLALGGGVMLMTVGITHRYVHDFYPFLLIASAAGVARLAAAPSKGFVGLFAFLTLLSVALNFMFAMEYQRLAEFGTPPAKRQEFLHVQQRVNAWFGIEPTREMDPYN